MYSTASQNMSSTDGKPIIIVSATMDSRSVFHDLTLGVENDISGLVAMLAVADAISKVRSPRTWGNHQLYQILNESSRTVSSPSGVISKTYSLYELQCRGMGVHRVTTIR